MPIRPETVQSLIQEKKQMIDRYKLALSGIKDPEEIQKAALGLNDLEDLLAEAVLLASDKKWAKAEVLLTTKRPGLSSI